MSGLVLYQKLTNNNKYTFFKSVFFNRAHSVIWLYVYLVPLNAYNIFKWWDFCFIWATSRSWTYLLLSAQFRYRVYAFWMLVERAGFEELHDLVVGKCWPGKTYSVCTTRILHPHWESFHDLIPSAYFVNKRIT